MTTLPATDCPVIRDHPRLPQTAAALRQLPGRVRAVAAVLIGLAAAVGVVVVIALVLRLWPDQARTVAPAAAPRPVDTARAACLIDQGSGGVWVETAQGRHACLEPGNVGALLLGLTARGTGQ